MLVLTRKRQEQLLIGKEIVVTIIEVAGGKVRLGIHAPANVLVLRAELVCKKQERGIRDKVDGR